MGDFMPIIYINYNLYYYGGFRAHLYYYGGFRARIA